MTPEQKEYVGRKVKTAAGIGEITGFMSDSIVWVRTATCHCSWLTQNVQVIDGEPP